MNTSGLCLRNLDIDNGPLEIIGVVFTYTFFYTIEKVVLYLQLTNPKVVSLTWPTLLKHSKAYSLQDWGWISLRGEWRLSCAPLSEVKLSVELVKRETTQVRS